MSIDQLPSSSNEYEKNQQVLVAAVSEAEALIEKGHAAYLAEGEQSAGTLDEGQAELRKFSGIFDLPDGEGQRKLSVRMIDEAEAPGPDSSTVVMEARYQEWLPKGRLMTVYTVAKMPDGDLVLETHPEDHSQVDEYREIAMGALHGAMGAGDIPNLRDMYLRVMLEEGMSAANESHRIVQSAAEEKAFGLHDAQPEDSEKLVALIQEATAQLDKETVNAALEELLKNTLDRYLYEEEGDDSREVHVTKVAKEFLDKFDAITGTQQERGGLLFFAKQNPTQFVKAIQLRVAEAQAQPAKSDPDGEDPGTETLLW